MRILKSITLDQEVNRLLREHAEKTGLSMSRIIERLLKEKLQKREDNK